MVTCIIVLGVFESVDWFINNYKKHLKTIGLSIKSIKNKKNNPAHHDKADREIIVHTSDGGKDEFYIRKIKLNTLLDV